ncbi:MAG: hypothetical protein ACYCU3_23345 [Streptosporangiaceae bacterium]
MSTANSKAMTVGFALWATGGLIGLVGIGVSGVAMANAARRWMRAQPEPPAVVMKKKIAQARAATTAATSAGTNAWHNGVATGSPR